MTSQKQLTDIGAEHGVRRVLALLYPHDIGGSGSTSRTIPRGSAKRQNNSLIFVAGGVVKICSSGNNNSNNNTNTMPHGRGTKKSPADLRRDALRLERLQHEKARKTTNSSTGAGLFAAQISDPWRIHVYTILGGGFKDALFSLLNGEMSQFDDYFSDGLVQPPTRIKLPRYIGIITMPF